MSIVKEDLKYSREHEWVQIQDGIAIIGITDFAQHSLGDIVYLEVKDVGEQVKAGEVCGTIESVKAAEDIYSPVSGEIIEKNESVLSSPELINQDPYQNWILKIKDIKESDLENLMDAKAYEEYLNTLESEE